MSQRNIANIARSEAMSQFSSTEQLDQRLVVVRGSAWLLLVLAMAFLVLALAWGFLGRVSRTVEGNGIIIPKDTRPVEVMSPSAFGGVVELMVPEFEDVKAGDPLVRLHNEELEIALANARRQLSDLQDQDRKLTESEDGILERRKAARDAQIAMSKTIIDQTGELVKMLKDEVADIESLVKDRLVPRSQLVSTRSTLFSSMQQVIEQQTQESQADIEYQTVVSTTEQSRLARMQEIATASDGVKAAESKIRASTVVHAPVSGRVLEHAVDLGSSIRAGMLVTSIRPAASSKEEGIEVISYVPFGKGKQIKAGMEVQVSLEYAKPTRYGYLKGKVDRVGEFVAGSTTEIHLGSSDLAQSMARSMGPMLEVVITMQADPDTPTGLAWTSSTGYGKPIEFPSLCGVRVITGEDRPIDLVIPWLKNVLGLDPVPGVLDSGDDSE